MASNGEKHENEKKNDEHNHTGDDLRFHAKSIAILRGVARAEAHMQGVQNTNLLAAFLEAQHNPKSVRMFHLEARRLVF